ncbi:UbiA family prenyltransferase [Pseudomonas alliivorans]|uniref:UbiA family prenyltransferase n=1 Tax=Pseudomonas alliivorans TaxID=2810613 RepID=UPI0016138064|nr:UbiA family prenyltransferase [Pseudomonas alliivorans]MBP0951683.1 UbiA family prenyltransferase [Pseudomonas alliivorans]MEE4334480.1 UbiA family prenyltransferase [Pseudomonas alliivorans]MEE4626075.1 UbiA family prenyltransferase [Pseudomonas alliivorans]MEE4666889.1 UbiA family prenyltransferase [Pseudomonas alliivorans]MEE4682179.1 UbiA family prenyltransferase [Pseudomonas alliivorans]
MSGIQGRVLQTHPPLVVDLDGTLLRSDVLFETAMAFIRQYPLQVFKLLLWLLQGKASLKRGLALSVKLDIALLPYDADVIEYIQQARRTGRLIVLATAAHETLATQIARHLNLFDQVWASDGEVNLSAHRKRDLLIDHYGQSGFDYIGNSTDDLCIWATARKAIVANPHVGVQRRAQAQGNVDQVLNAHATSLKDWRKALRLHQWLKNALIFVPLLAAHQIQQSQQVIDGLLAFLFFGLCASSVYVLNDLLDLADDRHHRSKRNRPFASGRLPIKSGLIAVPTLLLLAFGGAAAVLPWQFSAVLGAYYLLTLVYSLYLKRHMAVDVIVLAMLYTTRILAGAAAFHLPLTFWILAFSMFLFLSLALVKRYAELREARVREVEGKTRGRGYYPGDLDMIASLGASSGNLAVMVLALYIHEGATIALYQHPHVIWLACPLLLFWITRIWMLTHRGLMNDDPVVFAIRDRISQGIGALFLLVFWVAA